MSYAADPIQAVPVIIGFVRAPEANVMTFLRAAADRFFKRQIFLPSEKIEVAHRGCVIRFPQDRIDDNADAAAKGQRIGGIPSGCDHGANNFLLRSDEGDVERIAGDAAGGVGHPRDVAKIGAMLFMMLPEAGKNHIRPEEVCDGDRDGDSRPGRESPFGLVSLDEGSICRRKSRLVAKA